MILQLNARLLLCEQQQSNSLRFIKLSKRTLNFRTKGSENTKNFWQQPPCLLDAPTSDYSDAEQY